MFDGQQDGGQLRRLLDGPHPRLMGGPHPEKAMAMGGACAGGAAMAAAGCGAQKSKAPFVGKTVGTGHSEATVSVRRKDVTKY